MPRKICLSQKSFVHPLGQPSFYLFTHLASSSPFISLSARRRRLAQLQPPLSAAVRAPAVVFFLSSFPIS